MTDAALQPDRVGTHCPDGHLQLDDVTGRLAHARTQELDYVKRVDNRLVRLLSRFVFGYEATQRTYQDSGQLKLGET